MSTIELRHIIIEKLSLIEDTSFLKAIKTIVESKADEKVYQLSDLQRKRISTSREQIKNGKTISNEEVNKEVLQWLNSK